jgi:hypothetical protein
MNERINELAKQCTYEYDDDFGKPHNDFDYEKFAKNLIDDIQRYDLVDNDSLEQIKRHFGVEE